MSARHLHAFGLAAILGSMPAAARAQAAFEGVITYRMTSGGRSTDMRLMSKGTKTRAELNLPNMPGPMVMLQDAETKMTYMVMQSMGMYMEMDMSKPTQPKQGGKGSTKFERLGTSETIAGTRCENYRFTDAAGAETESCIATGMGSWLGGGGPPGGQGGVSIPDFSAYASEFTDGMLALRVKAKRGGEWVTVLEATTVDRKLIDAALLELPQGLRKMGRP